jgi:hypothetical protein
MKILVKDLKVNRNFEPGEKVAPAGFEILP